MNQMIHYLFCLCHELVHELIYRSWIILGKVHELVHVSREKFMNLLVRELPFVVHGFFMKSVHDLVHEPFVS